jgi:hypothetical protein
MKFSTKAQTLPNPCLECGEQCRRPKRFCSESHKEEWLVRRIFKLDAEQIARVEAQRKRLGITPESLEWKRKLHVSQPF